jgi:hypothetical protein
VKGGNVKGSMQYPAPPARFTITASRQLSKRFRSGKHSPVKIKGVKVLALLAALASLSLAQLRSGNFSIRVEPTAAVQANVEVPFEIRVTDDLHKPLINATVTLQVETQDQHSQIRVFRAARTEPGVYVAKPVFPSAGQWTVYVEVRRDLDMSARTFDYSVPDSVSP